MLRPGSFLGFVLVALVALSGAACSRVRVHAVQGPDGADWAALSCRHMDKRCFRAAAAMCPSGYYFANAAGPVTSDEQVISSSAGPEPRPGVNVQRLPPQERWGSRMYSRKGGTILVKCAAATAQN